MTVNARQASEKMRFRVNFEIDEDTIGILRKFMEQEGINSVNIAARAAMMASLSPTPHWAVLSEERKAITHELRRQLITKVAEHLNVIFADVSAAMLLAESQDALLTGGTGGTPK